MLHARHEKYNLFCQIRQIKNFLCQIGSKVLPYNLVKWEQLCQPTRIWARWEVKANAIEALWLRCPPSHAEKATLIQKWNCLATCAGDEEREGEGGGDGKRGLAQECREGATGWDRVETWSVLSGWPQPSYRMSGARSRENSTQSGDLAKLNTVVLMKYELL